MVVVTVLFNGGTSLNFYTYVRIGGYLRVMYYYTYFYLFIFIKKGSYILLLHTYVRMPFRGGKKYTDNFLTTIENPTRLRSGRKRREKEVILTGECLQKCSHSK